MPTYYVDPSVAPNADWAAGTVYSLGAIVCTKTHGTAAARYVYECTDAGTSHATDEPTWDATPGNTTADNDVVWTCRAPDSWGEALNDFQGAVDLVASGDTIYCRGTQTLTVRIDLDSTAGIATSLITCIGCASSGSVDGTRFTLDANSGAFDVMYVNGTDYWIFRNFIFKRGGTGKYGINTAASYTDGCIFNNCRFTNNASGGVLLTAYQRNWLFYRCLFDNNNHGIDGNGGVQTYFVACRATANTSRGFDSYLSNAFFLGCTAHDNESGFVTYGTGILVNCVADHNTNAGFDMDYSGGLIIGCRFTDVITGGVTPIKIDGASSILLLHTYLDDVVGGTNAAYLKDCTDELGVSTNIFSGGEAADGYDGSTLNLDPDVAVQYNVAIEIPSA